MSNNSDIAWTQATWNPCVGCTPVSPGCDLCYAATMSARLEAMHKPDYGGLTVKRQAPKRAEIGAKERPVFNGVVRTLPHRLGVPMEWKSPKLIFVNSMSDLYHEEVPFEFADRVFSVMAKTPWHTYQILTKRPERMAKHLHSLIKGNDAKDIREHLSFVDRDGDRPWGDAWESFRWPLPNVWLGTSVENQAEAATRIPHLTHCQAALLFLSCEPLLELIRLRTGVYSSVGGGAGGTTLDGIGWVIVGCESRGGMAGRFAEGYEEAARHMLGQCRAAATPFRKGPAFFHKQMPILRKTTSSAHWRVSHDMAQWPEDLRVQEMPEKSAA